MSTLLERARRGECLADLDIIDAHGHIGRTAFPIMELSPASIVADMDRVGVRCIIVSHIQCLAVDAAGGNREVLQAMRQHPGRILGYAGLWPDSAEQVRQETLRCLEDGFTGVKLHNSNGFPYTDPAYAPALLLADQRRLPVLLHTWGGDAEFAQVKELATKHPQASFILAHSGCLAVEKYIQIAREHANVYLDTTQSARVYGVIARMVKEAGSEKVIWGTDSFFLNMAQQLGSIIGADLSDQDKLQVLSKNARRILDRILR